MGAHSLAKYLAKHTGAPLHAVTVTRLLIECNRSPANPARFSALARQLCKQDREWLHEHVWRPHHDALHLDIAARIRKGPVLHLSVHSFTPILDGKPRRADVALLYDPASKLECEFAGRWLSELAQIAPGLRLRRNYPYKGTSDGMTRLLRREFAGQPYAGVELEVSQALLRETTRKGRLHALLGDTLLDL